MTAHGRCWLMSASNNSARAARPSSCPMASGGRWKSPPRLALDPELLLLDEPMSGLGQEDVGRITDLITPRRASPHRADGGAQSLGRRQPFAPHHGAGARRNSG